MESNNNNNNNNIKLKFQKYINDYKINKLECLIQKNIDSLNDDDEFTCELFGGIAFTTSLLYYLIAIECYDLARLILSKGFNVYKGKA